MTAAAAIALALLSAAAGALLAWRRSPREGHDAEDALGRIAADAPIAFWTIDRSGVITMARGRGLARALGPPEALVGRSAAELIADHPRIGARIREAFEGKPASALAELNGRLMEATCLPSSSPTAGSAPSTAWRSTSPSATRTRSCSTTWRAASPR